MKDAGWIMVCALSMVASVSHAASFAARPTLAQAEKWVNKAAHTLLVLDERRVATSDHQWPQGRRTRSGSISNLVSFLKQDAVSLASQYLDQSKAPSGNYNEWFKQNPSLSLPQYNRNSLIIHAGVPFDVEGKTPGTVIANLGPASSTHGLDACAALIAKLTWLPVRQLNQSNLVSEINLQTNGYLNIEEINRGDRSSDGCMVGRHVETIEDRAGNIQRCANIKSSATNRWTNGSAQWFIKASSAYELQKTQQNQDYKCAPCPGLRIWDLSKSSREQSRLSYRKVETVRSDAYCQIKPSIRGSIEVYSSVWSSTRDEVNGNVSVPVGCDQQRQHAYSIPEWAPAWKTSPTISGSSGVSWNSTISKIEISNPAGVKLPENAYQLVQYDRTCDTRTGPLGFGVWCYGTQGSLMEESVCESVIPEASADVNASHALVKVQPRYMP